MGSRVADLTMLWESEIVNDSVLHFYFYFGFLSFVQVRGMILTLLLDYYWDEVVQEKFKILFKLCLIIFWT